MRVRFGVGIRWVWDLCWFGGKADLVWCGVVWLGLVWFIVVVGLVQGWLTHLPASSQTWHTGVRKRGTICNGNLR